MSIADKLTYLQTTKQLLKTEINKINNVLDDNSTFRSYPQELFNGYLDVLNNGTDTLWSNLEKVSASGEEATLENVETAPIKMVLNGNTSQDGEPTPDDPKDIHVVKGENVLSVQGKNLFDGILELGNINSTTGEKMVNSNYIINTNPIPVEELTNYKISSNGEGIKMYIFEYKEDLSYNLTNRKSVEANAYFTTNSGTRYISFRPVSSITNLQEPIQIERGTTATPYVPYSKTDYPINLGDIELCEINTYKDFPFKAINGNEYYDTLTDEQKNALNYGSWYVHKEIGKKIFDGTEFWRTVPTNTTDVYRMLTTSLKGSILAPATSSTQFLAFCSRFKPIIADDTYKKNEGISCARDENVHIYMEDYNTSTSATDFKTWLSTHNVTLYYVLSTPTETEITNTTLIEQLEAIYKAKSVKDKTYITQTNDELPFILDVEAIKEYEVN